MFTSLGVKDIVDIILVAVLLYYLYKLMKDSGTIKIFGGVMAFVSIWILVSRILDMKLLGSILDKLVSVGVIILVVLFQDQIRRFLGELGSQKRWKAFLKFFKRSEEKDGVPAYVLPLVYACINMSKRQIGALIVVERELSLDRFVATGERVDADINPRLIESIFYKGTPLHDGAMIISDNRITAAGCILPVSHSNNIPRELGLRHRSGLGIAQESDAISIIVSEETGEISIAKDGRLNRNVSPQRLESMLSAN